MLRVFQDEIQDKDHFVVTLELVPGRESSGRAVDTLKNIARDAFSDGRVSAVSITDNPGGNPSLSPDAMSREIFRVGMDVIVHFACRDMNRVGMESRALQLAMMGIKNILAVTGDYTGVGFGGQGAPVFDLDSVHLLILLNLLNKRLEASGDPDGFFTGCAVSPFKYTEPESFAQYAKFCRKQAAGAKFAITQLGYDMRKFAELIRIQKTLEAPVPVMGTVYLLTPKVARVMNKGLVPGAVVDDMHLERIEWEWRVPKEGRKLAVERAARLAAVLKGLGFRGVHFGGIHKSFDDLGTILDRMEKIEDQWESFIEDFTYPKNNRFYAFNGYGSDKMNYLAKKPGIPFWSRFHYRMLSFFHKWFFDYESRLAPDLKKIAEKLNQTRMGRRFVRFLEMPPKRMLLNCMECGDCGIQHLAFLCPESQCPKHTRNGACGGSRNGMCEVFPNRYCVWFKVYKRWACDGKTRQMVESCIPPRMWELYKTPSWLNFHLKKDHQSASTSIALSCRVRECGLTRDAGAAKRTCSLFQYMKK